MRGMRRAPRSWPRRRSEPVGRRPGCGRCRWRRTTWRSSAGRAAGIWARSRALVAEDGEAAALYEQAIEALGQGPTRWHLARAELLYGEWLRRRGERAAAREQLRAAYERFAEAGGRGFAERAYGELVATGERARRRAPETRDELTPQELRIARLARDGCSNPDIAAQ